VRSLTPADRAEKLVEGNPAAAEVLRFAAGVLRAQRPFSDLAQGAKAAVPLLEFIAEQGPDQLALDAATALETGFEERLRDYWLTSQPDWLARTALMPFARGLRERGIAIERGEGPCKMCGGRPWISSRRAASNTDGASRFLHCALCSFAWQVPRIRCPRCDEQDPEKLPGFSVPQHPFARIEACETCRGYVKSIDLTVDARAIPEIDDLASLTLDLWAVEQKFTRLETGLAGF
jgi:FdhE protein